MTAGDFSCICPPSPAGSLLPVPSTSVVPVVLRSQLLGVEGKNSRDLIVQYKNLLKSTGLFVVPKSSNGNVQSSSDLWFTWADLIGTSGGGLGDSWLQANSTKKPYQFVINVNVAGTIQWTELGIWFSPSGSFSGGTVLARPTAPDEINLSPAQWLGTGPAGDPQFYATVWLSTDGSIHRVLFWFGGQLVSFWSFEQVAQAPTGWTFPYLTEMFITGNDYSAPAFRYTYPRAVLAVGSGGSLKSFNTNAPLGTGAQGGFLSYPGGTSVVLGAPATQPVSGQRFWDVARAVIVSGGGGTQNGIWGFFADEWFINATGSGALNDGDTVGDNHDFIVCGDRLLQWGIGVPSLGGASTNYPTAGWFGRNVVTGF